MPFDFIASKDFYITNVFVFSQSFDFEHTRWRWFQKRVVCTKFDIYIFIWHEAGRPGRNWKDWWESISRKPSIWTDRDKLSSRKRRSIVDYNRCSINHEHTYSVGFESWKQIVSTHGQVRQENFWAPGQKETWRPPPILQIMILKLSPPRCVISKE